MLEIKRDYYLCFKRTGKFSCGRKIIKYKDKKQKHCNNFYIDLYMQFDNINKYNKVICYNYNYIIALHTRPEDIVERLLYREIYKKKKNIKLLFFTTLSNSSKINKYNENEMKNENDLITQKFQGSYCKGSLQMSLSFYWINEHCNNYQYVIYHQADVYLNIMELLKFIELNDIELSGFILYKERRITNQNKLHYVPSSFYEKKILPPYPRGPLFIVNKKIIRLITNKIVNSSKIIWIDDMSIGFIFLNKNISTTDFRKLTVFYNPSKSISLNSDFISNKTFSWIKSW